MGGDEQAREPAAKETPRRIRRSCSTGAAARASPPAKPAADDGAGAGGEGGEALGSRASPSPCEEGGPRVARWMGGRPRRVPPPRSATRRRPIEGEQSQSACALGLVAPYGERRMSLRALFATEIYQASMADEPAMVAGS